MLPLRHNPILSAAYERLKEPAPEAAPDAILIEAAEVAKERLEVIRNDMRLRFAELVEAPLKVRSDLDKKMTQMEAEVLRLQQAIADAKVEYLESETQWIKGQESYEAIELFYKPQILSLETQANYVPLAQRATVSRRRKPKRKPNDSTFDS